MMLALEWTLTASLLILAVTALRALLGKRVSAGLRYALWGVVLARLLVPVQIFPIFTPAASPPPELDSEPVAVSAPAPSEAPPVISAGVPVMTEPAPGGAAVNYDAAPESPAASLDVSRLWSGFCWLWLAGSAVMGLALLWSNLRFARRLRRVRVPLADAAGEFPLPVYRAEGLSSPCLFGAVRPAVYLTPEAADEAMLRHVLAHEYTHFCHGDHIWNILRSAALALHWWNPLVWLAAALSRRDSELACDEGALKRLGEGERIAYGRTLLALLSGAEKAGPGALFTCATTMTGGQKSVFDRITRIAQGQKRWLWAAVALVLAVGAACVCAFGLAAEPEDTLSVQPAIEVGRGELVWELDRDNYPALWETELDEYPSVTFRCSAGDVTATAEEGETQLFTGMPVWDLYLCDLTGDGKRELCSRISLGSGVVDDRILVYDYAAQTLYELEDRMTYDYTLRLEDGRLWAEEWHYTASGHGNGEWPRRAGPLLLEEGRLVIQAEALALPDGLSCSIPEGDGGGYVLMDGLGGRVEWHGPNDSPSNGWLYFTNPAAYCACPTLEGREVTGSAQWVDESRAAVSVVMNVEGGQAEDGTARGFYIYFHVDWNTGNILQREFSSGVPGESLVLSDREMADMGRVMAALLTAGEDYYYDTTQPLPMPALCADVLRGAPFHSVHTGNSLTLDTMDEEVGPGYDITQYAVVDLDGDGAAEVVLWLQGPDILYLILRESGGVVNGYGCSYRAMNNIKADGTFYDRYVADGEGMGVGYSTVSFTESGFDFHPFTYELSLPSREDGSDSNYRLVVDGQPADSQAYRDATARQDAKPGVIWYAFPPDAVEEAVPEPAPMTCDPIQMRPEYAINELGTSMTITGIDAESAQWYARKLSASFDTPEHALGHLGLSRPAFLGDRFLEHYSDCTALYSPEDDPDLVWIMASSPETGKVICCTVNLVTGEAVNLEINDPDVKTVRPELSNGEMLSIAHALKELILGASAAYEASLPAPEEGPLPFDRPMKLWFGSGAGGWRTILTLHPDGSFEGDYSDYDMGVSGPGFDSTVYVCQFHGRFQDIAQVTPASWSMTLEELVVDTGHPIGETWIETVRNPDGSSYRLGHIASGPYGMDGKDGEPLRPGARFMFYTPEAKGFAPTDELYGMKESDDYESRMYQFWGWWPDKHSWDSPSDTLGCYGLCSMERGSGFFDLHAWGLL